MVLMKWTRTFRINKGTYLGNLIVLSYNFPTYTLGPNCFIQVKLKNLNYTRNRFPEIYLRFDEI
jgi:hypothetical protein